MSDYVWKHLPYAIYLDTNALRSAGLNLEDPWINKLLSITNDYSISVFISELVLAEWCEHIMEKLESQRQKLLSLTNSFKKFEITVPDIKADEIKLPEKTKLNQVLLKKLKTFGINVIKNWDAPLSHLLSEAIVKKPPFAERGKGLCDVVILESYAKHAKENLPEARVLIVSRDGDVKRSEARFKDQNIVVEFVDELQIVGKLESLLNDEVAAYIKNKNLKLKEYILTHEATILNYVRKTPLKITNWMLESPWLNKKEDRVDGTIERILAVRPTKINDVIGGTPMFGDELSTDRYPVRISVQIELDIVVSQFSSAFYVLGQTRAIVQPDTVDSTTPVELKPIDWKSREFSKTIKRNLTVIASLDAVKEKDGILEDFRIEKII